MLVSCLPLWAEHKISWLLDDTYWSVVWHGIWVIIVLETNENFCCALECFCFQLQPSNWSVASMQMVCGCLTTACFDWQDAHDHVTTLPRLGQCPSVVQFKKRRLLNNNSAINGLRDVLIRSFIFYLPRRRCVRVFGGVCSSIHQSNSQEVHLRESWR